MSIFQTIIHNIDVFEKYDLPIRVSYYDTYCDIYILSEPPRIMHIEYKSVERACAGIKADICNLCNEKNDNSIACFKCGNSYCPKCFIKLICVNYHIGSYMCPYCKCPNLIPQNEPLLKTIVCTLRHFNISKSETLQIITSIMKESPNLIT